MAATSDIVLNDYAASAKTFTPAIAIANGYQYQDTGSSISSPRTLQVKHILLPASAQNGVETHSVSFGHTVADPVTGKPFTVVATLSFRVPRTGPTLGNRRDLWSFTKNFLTDSNVEKLLIGGF